MSKYNEAFRLIRDFAGWRMTNYLPIEKK
jgi:hypothetical protein